MTVTTAYTLAPHEAPWRADVGGISLRLLARSEDTDGRCLMMHYQAPPGWPGPPLHRHADLDEAVYALQGRIRLRLGDDDHDLEAGGFAWLPREVPHAFANLGDQPAVFFGVVTPPGRMQEFFETVTKELAGSDGPPDPERLMQLNADHGIEVLGPPLGAPGA